MNVLNIPEEHVIFSDNEKEEFDFGLTIFQGEDKFRFCADGKSTRWISPDEGFVSRIRFENLNPCFRKEHILKEIEILNLFDDAIVQFGNEKYKMADNALDDVLFYDPEYGEAILLKSRILFAQGHFVKSLRHYRKALRADESLEDADYYRLLLKKSSEERDNFPKIKRSIYSGDEYFSKGEYDCALECYQKALEDHTKFKDRILSKLLMKKAKALFKLKRYEDAFECFKKSADIEADDMAYFHMGIIESFLGWNLSIEFKGHLNISKNQMVKKAGILKNAGEFSLGLECLDEYFSSQFFVNDKYLLALTLKLNLLETLDLDTDEIKGQIAMLM